MCTTLYHFQFLELSHVVFLGDMVSSQLSITHNHISWVNIFHLSWVRVNSTASSCFLLITQYNTCLHAISRIQVTINTNNTFTMQDTIWIGCVCMYLCTYVIFSDECSLLIGCDESCDIS